MEGPGGQPGQQARLGPEQSVYGAHRGAAADDEVTRRHGSALTAVCPRQSQEGGQVGQVPEQVEAVAHAQQLEALRAQARQDLVAAEALNMPAEAPLQRPLTPLPG